MKIYALVWLGREISGHGETSPYAKLASTLDYEKFVSKPLFRTRHNAEEYLAKIIKDYGIGPEIIELDLI